ncbi:hypothetical protein Moror_4202 [Moniliophthora roreri MCA 2997]|uniref:Uncharacterized protein n=2 Tax=Moniliophthora roreri TaxID=221103 RepID=V2WUX8_MONRO|nr:hypothetical protein Moror_4202 [Moniliophthora roreri MCA 2997]KAI3597445.1 hypothetical protein WG66_013209 [Moniliophthora roreri]
MSFAISQAPNAQVLFGGIVVPERDVIDEIVELYVDFEGGDTEPSFGGAFEVEGVEEMERILEAFMVTNGSSEIHSSLGHVANAEYTNPNVVINNSTLATPDTATRTLWQRSLNVNAQRHFNIPAIKLNTQSKSQNENRKQKVGLEAEHSNSISNQRHVPPPSLYKMLSTGWR